MSVPVKLHLAITMKLALDQVEKSVWMLMIATRLSVEVAPMWTSLPRALVTPALVLTALRKSLGSVLKSMADRVSIAVLATLVRTSLLSEADMNDMEITREDIRSAFPAASVR